MKTLSDLFKKNKNWAESVLKNDPQFFEKLSSQQHPKYLWIGCSDSRVPATQITGLEPGEVFVHRNVGNIVAENDPNCMAVIQFAVEALKVTDIIICGHYGCGGVQASKEGIDLDLVSQWIQPVKDVYLNHKSEIDKIQDSNEQLNRLCELNVIEQVLNVKSSPVVKEALNRKQEVNVHGWIYSLKDGLLKDLKVT